ncbi:hypothetical protein ACG95N_14115 [Acinetobacter guillouiae]|uniref:hypothetical protein n=1 Tax=Acinetobacter guillouiae TaxID=106649 RepID=UPI003AF71090
MKRKKTGFFTDEWCFWHTTRLHASVLPVGGWVQSPAATAHGESPESNRRFKNLLDVSGLTKQLETLSALPANEEDLAHIT